MAGSSLLDAPLLFEEWPRSRAAVQCAAAGRGIPWPHHLWGRRGGVQDRRSGLV